MAGDDPSVCYSPGSGASPSLRIGRVRARRRWRPSALNRRSGRPAGPWSTEPLWLRSLAYEIRHVRGERVERAPGVDIDPEQLVRDGVVVPTEPLLSRLAGRVQPRRIGASNDTGRLAPDQRPTVTAAVRFHDIGGLPGLERSLYCLAAQRGVDLDVVVAYQDQTPMTSNVSRTRSMRHGWVRGGRVS